MDVNLEAPDQTWSNLTTIAMWAVVAIIGLSFYVLGRGIKQVLNGKKVDKGMIPYVKWPLLFASAGFNVFFTFYVFLPAGMALAVGSSVVMGGVNLAEAYLVRLTIASWRHGLTVVYRVALGLTIPIFAYSLMAAGSSYSTMMNKNQDVQIATTLQVEASKDRIREAEALVNVAKGGAQSQGVLNALYQTDVTNTLGAKVNFRQVKQSCESGGYYSTAYPALCNQYQQVNNGQYTNTSVAGATADAYQVSAEQKEKMASTIMDRPPVISPTLLGLSLGIAAVGFIVSLALESAIIGVGFFEELFIKPTPLPALVSFRDKSLDWEVEDKPNQALHVDVSPSPGTISIGEKDVPDLIPPLIPSGETIEPQTPPVLSAPPVPSGDALQDGSDGSAPSAPSGDAQKHFNEWIELLQRGELNPTIKPTVRYLTRRVSTAGIEETEALAKVWLNDAKEKGVIIDNPKSGVGRALYVLTPKNKA